jgi:Tat protein secretion system quality control protein TatD with DNase activity
MQFTGRNLQTVSNALAAAISYCHTEIGLHPEPLNYPEDIEELEAERAKFDHLKALVDQAIQDER